MAVETPGMPEPAERLAVVLAEGGMQRMAARVLAAFLFSERTTVTAGDVAEQLSVSPAAVSGAIKTLTTVGLIERMPVPASRRDHYRMRPDAWETLFTSQNAVVRAMWEVAGDGVKVSADGGEAERRLRRMADFYDFMLSELPALIERWQERRAELPGS